MIVRIVRLTFNEGGKEAFFKMLETKVEIVRNQLGCSYLEILEDIHQVNHVTTYSHWESEEDLNAYRHSEFFKEFWPEVKRLLEKPASAYSFFVNRKLP